MTEIRCTSCGETVPDLPQCIECGANPRALEIPCHQCRGTGYRHIDGLQVRPHGERSTCPCPERGCYNGMIEAPYAA